MIYLDNPTLIRVGDLQAVIKGWYAGTSRCAAIALRAGSAEVPAILAERSDVQQVYPDLFSQGFHCILDFVRHNFEAAYVPRDSGGALTLEISPDNAEPVAFHVPVENGWFEDLRRLKGSDLPTQADAAIGLLPGDAHYRAYVGLPEHYDLTAASTFNLLTSLGLRQYHRLIDIGCGSLRNGRLLIPYLNAGNYMGVEPNRWLVDQGLRAELGTDILRAKRPRFLFSDSPAILADLPVSTYALANSIFTHASLEQIRGWLSHLAERLSLGGVLIATYVEGKEDYGGENWIYPQCVRYRRETMAALSAACSYQMVCLDWRHLHGATWALFARPGFPVAEILARPLGWNALVDRNTF
jgi:hypothetical protein